MSSSSTRQRTINLSVIPGAPTDGTGQVCIHLFVQDTAGAFTEPHVLTPMIKDGLPVRQLDARAVRGRIACDPRRIPRKVVGNVVTLVMRTDDPRAVTCPACKSSQVFKDLESRNNILTGDSPPVSTVEE